MTPDIDPTAACDAKRIGAHSRVLAFARLGPDVTVGEDCFVGDHAVLEGEVTLADDVQIEGGARIVGPVTVGRRAAVGVGAVLSGTERTSGTADIVVGADAQIGANAAVLPGVSIGRSAVVRPGSIVTDSVPAHAIVAGNPARIVAYVESTDLAVARERILTAAPEKTIETAVGGVTIHPVTHARDLRGSLAALEFRDLPFVPLRAFVVFDVPSETVRGSHAHRVCAQFLVCLAGGVSCLVDDGTAREDLRLATADAGVYMPPMTWGTQWRYTHDAILLVLASHPYDPADYVRDYEEFLTLLDRRKD